MRLIDAEPVEEWIGRHADKALGKNPYERARICAFRRALECVLSAPTIASPPNPPLSLAELREMDGEPVWVELITKNNTGFYAIVHGNMVSDGRMTYNTAREIFSLDKDGAYGVIWLAYRRKPEKEGHD